MDRALSEATSWRADSGYGVVPRKIFRDGWVYPVRISQLAPLLLKLHGSSNWLTSYPFIDPRSKVVTPTQTSSPETLYVYEDGIKPYDCYDGRYMAGYQAFSYGYYPPNILDDNGKALEKGHVLVHFTPRYPGKPKGMAGKRGLVSMPLIIPPVKEKRYDSFGSLFTNIWAKAEDTLARADTIAVIGYSFPQTDHRSIRLFRDAFMRRKTTPYVKIVDPNPFPVAERFRNEFGIPSDHVAVFADYFSDSFDLTKLFR